MNNKIEHWENKSREADHELFLKNHKTRLNALLTVDATILPESKQKQHSAKIKYLQAVIETIEGMQEIVIGMAKAYRNNLLTPEEKLNIMAGANPALTELMHKLDCELKP